MFTGVYTIPYPPPHGGGKFFKSDWNSYQVVKRGREYHGCMKEYNVNEREKRSNIIFPVILKLLRRIPSGVGVENFGESYQD